MKCKNCDKWTGNEENGYGSCMIKQKRKDKNFITYGKDKCNESDEDIRKISFLKS